MSLLTNLTSYYKLDESSGNAVDSSSNGNTLTNTNSVTYGAGILNNGAIFAHLSGQYLLSNTNLGFTSSSANTWSFWIKPTTVLNGGYYMDIMTTSGARRGISIYDRGPNLGIYTWANDFDSGVTFINGTWYFVTVTNNGSGTVECFVNAVSKGTVALGTSSSSNVDAVTVGGQYGTATATSSTMDEVGVWSRVLSGSEITQLYNGGSPLPFSQFNPSLTKNLYIYKQAVNRASTY